MRPINPKEFKEERKRREGQEKRELLIRAEEYEKGLMETRGAFKNIMKFIEDNLKRIEKKFEEHKSCLNSNILIDPNTNSKYTGRFIELETKRNILKKLFNLPASHVMAAKKMQGVEENK